MNMPIWTKPAILGALAGAIATMIVGFSQGGWYTTGSAERMAYQKSATAVIAALVPICISHSKVDPDSTAKLAQFSAMKTSYEQRDFVMKAGWATMPTAEQPDRDLATACADMLSRLPQG
jgi:hypothetical protein